MFLTICQACHKGRKLSANNGQEITTIYYCLDFQQSRESNIVYFVTHEDYEVIQSLAIKPLRDDFIQIYFGKHQTTIGKHSHRILVTIPYFRGNYHS